MARVVYRGNGTADARLIGDANRSTNDFMLWTDQLVIDVDDRVRGKREPDSDIGIRLRKVSRIDLR